MRKSLGYIMTLGVLLNFLPLPVAKDAAATQYQQQQYQQQDSDGDGIRDSMDPNYDNSNYGSPNYAQQGQPGAAVATSPGGAAPNVLTALAQVGVAGQQAAQGIIQQGSATQGAIDQARIAGNTQLMAQQMEHQKELAQQAMNNRPANAGVDGGYGAGTGSPSSPDDDFGAPHAEGNYPVNSADHHPGGGIIQTAHPQYEAYKMQKRQHKDAYKTGKGKYKEEYRRQKQAIQHLKETDRAGYNAQKQRLKEERNAQKQAHKQQYRTQKQGIQHLKPQNSEEYTAQKHQLKERYRQQRQEHKEQYKAQKQHLKKTNREEYNAQKQRLKDEHKQQRLERKKQYREQKSQARQEQVQGLEPPGIEGGD